MNLPPVEDVTPPSLVLFDLDDTLFDDRYARLAALRDLRGAEPVLARRPLSALSREYGRLLDAGYPAVMSGDVPPEEARALRFERLAMYSRLSAERGRRARTGSAPRSSRSAARRA